MVELLPAPGNFVEFVYGLIKDACEKKKKPLKAQDLLRDLPKQYTVDKEKVKMAIKELVDSGRVVYTYFGGSFLELPHVEGAAKNL